MNWHTVRVLFAHELRMLLRHRRTIVLAIVLPLATMPLLLYVSRAIQRRGERTLQETIYRYAVVGPESDEVRRLIDLQRSAAPRRPRPKKGEDAADSEFRFQEMTVRDPAKSLEEGGIHFYIETLSGAEADALPVKPVPKEDELERRPSRQKNDSGLLKAPERPPGTPLARIIYYGDRDDSRTGRTRMREFFLDAVRTERDALLEEKSLPLDPEGLFAVDENSVASAAQATGSQIGRFLTLFLIMFILSGGSIVALDIIAGEKERGSLETLLTTAASRAEIVAAKQFAILSVALCILLIHVTNILVYVNFRIIELPKDWVIRVSPLAAACLVCLFVPVAAFLSAVLLSLSAYARSYKEAQMYFFPVYLVSLAPAVASVLPGVTLRSAIAFVPLANVSVAAREVMVGNFDWLMLAVTMVVMAWAAVWMVRVSTRMLSSERLITAGDFDRAAYARGPALFSRHVIWWYALMAAALIAGVVNVPQLRTFRAQLLFNELVIFLGCSLLMIWRYRLNLREALALRPVRPAAWIGVLAAVPSGNLVGIGVFRLANLVVPVPPQILEQFGREIFPEGISVWQLVFFLAVLPGICEEVAFRGTLLYGLHRRLRPVALTLVVGLIFGLFHIALFRIIPTAFLGVVLTAIALLTGSIFPGMLVHAGNNAWSYWLARAGISMSSLHWGYHVAAAAVFAASLALIYRFRTPYPGLITSAPRARTDEARSAASK